MSEGQLALLDADERPTLHPCPTCHGRRSAPRPLYPDEDGAPGFVLEPCRSCRATGTVDYDPADDSLFPCVL